MSEYGNVVLTLSNVLLPLEKLYPNPTPSTSEGLPWDAEYDLRLIGCELIQTACLLLKLPQVNFNILEKNRFYLVEFLDSSCNWSSIISSLFLFFILCSSSYGNNGYGMY